MTCTLHALLDANLELPPEYGHQLSNHLPMALQALQRLGADGPRLHAFHAAYAARFEGRREQPAAFTALRERFAAELARDGDDATLRRNVPALLPGVAGAAFHGVIRTAHAVQAGHRGELAAALAYWAWRQQPLAVPARRVAALPFDAWAAALIGAVPSPRLEGPLFSQRIEQAEVSAPYQALAAALPTGADAASLLAQLAAFALERYLATRNFTVLHLVTGLRALRVLMPWLDDAATAQAALVRAVVAAYLAARVAPGAPSPSPSPPLPRGTSGWPAVIVAAIAHDDEHVIKLVEACRAEAHAYADARYLQAAALVFG